MPAGAAGQDAVEHVHAAPHGLDQVDRLADPHEIAWAVDRQHVGGKVQHLTHRRMPLADGQAAEGVAVEADLLQPVRGLATQVFIGRALLDAEQGLGLARAEGGLGPDRPAGRQLHTLAGAPFLCGPGHALVQLHGDIGAEAVGLDLDRPFRRQHVFGAVDVAGEGHRLLLNLRDAGEGHDLEATAVGQDGFGPAHEPVQPAQPLHPLGARAQHQVIGVAQQDVGPRLGHLIDRQGLDRGRRAHGHEGGCADIAARRLQHAGARGAVGGGDVEGKGQGASQ